LGGSALRPVGGGYPDRSAAAKVRRRLDFRNAAAWVKSARLTAKRGGGVSYEITRDLRNVGSPFDGLGARTGEGAAYSSNFSNRKAAGDFRNAVSWLKSAGLTAKCGGGVSYEIEGAAYEKRKKSRIRREKSESEILVNGYDVARVNQESPPWVAARRCATARDRAPGVDFPLRNQ
jgi:hypothetical protein